MRRIFFPLLLILPLTACSDSAPPALVLDGEGVFEVASADPEKPRLRYVDGQVSLSNTCGILLENGLNPKVPPMYVNGAPIGFC